MREKSILNKLNLYELIFQVLLHAMVFIFFAYDTRCFHEQKQIDLAEVVIFANYALAAGIINYYLLPNFLYLKKYLLFIIYVIVLILIVIFIEEAIIEQIFYPNTKGTKFPGIFINLLDALPTITILAGFKFAWDALTKQRQVEKLQMAMKDSELQYLKSQINPHFLFNNLNNLYSYALEQSPKTPDIILELSSVLRYMLYECKEKYVSLQNEIQQLENFVNLSKLQFEDRGEINFTVNNINPGYKIAPLILSVFVENAFKHSSSSQVKDIKIDLGIKLQEDVLYFNCENSFSPVTNTNDLS